MQLYSDVCTISLKVYLQLYIIYNSVSMNGQPGTPTQQLLK